MNDAVNLSKTELEKMLAGELYDGGDPLLVSMRLKARKLFTRYNQTDYADVQQRYEILQQLLGNLGTSIDIQAPFYCDYGCYIHAGENVFMNFNCIILDCNHVYLGDNVFFGPNVQVYTAYHPLNAQERVRGPEYAAPISIGNNVWVGGSAIICQGVTIGDNTTIGAGSVVVRDIPANVFAAGNPCRVIRALK